MENKKLSKCCKAIPSKVTMKADGGEYELSSKGILGM